MCGTPSAFSPNLPQWPCARLLQVALLDLKMCCLLTATPLKLSLQENAQSSLRETVQMPVLECDPSGDTFLAPSWGRRFDAKSVLLRTIPRTLISIRAYTAIQLYSCIRIISGKLFM